MQSYSIKLRCFCQRFVSNNYVIARKSEVSSIKRIGTYKILLDICTIE